jgi:hypothetical protein
MGVALVGTAVLANQIGLDHDPGWGIRRLLVLVIGSLLILAGLAIRGYSHGTRPVLDRIRSAPLGHPAISSESRKRVVDLLGRSRSLRVYVLAASGAVLVVIVYVWFVSVGYWSFWPKTTHTYDLLATAFTHGQISLEEPPDPALLRLPDPYDPAARQGIQFPWDASLYNGRYYLYWGPVPGLILAGIKLFYPGEIADQYLVFAFLLGTFIFTVFLLLALWHRFFREEIGGGAMLISVPVAGLLGSATWLLNRPAGYEAAIAGGQLFYMAGVYFACTAAIYSSKSMWRLIAAGASWALGVGSRAPTLIPISFLALMMIAWLINQNLSRGEFMKSIAGLIVPLAIGAVALAWYNWARFGSATEFGLRYQLTVINLHQLYDQAFSIRYVLDNLRNYLANPVRIGRIFPFLTALPPQFMPPGPAAALAPDEIEPVTGLVFGSPFLVLAAAPVLSILACGRKPTLADSAKMETQDARILRGISVCLLAGSALSFASLLLYFYPTMRQLEDFVPSATVVAILGFWQGWRYARAHAFWRMLYAIVAVALAFASVLVSCLLAITSYDDRFLHFHRDLLRLMIHFFGR